ncbi:MAG: iron-sulfur cluster assembly accessory protein [Fimbriimonadaceae bacterium]|nr:MAG: iron-sulfur cluster assembly accessory protein [Fimbriimonadaceae bacterium]
MSESFPVEITPEAVAQIAKLLARKGSEGSFLRIGVKGGGCSGLEYLFKLDDQPKDIDLVWEGDGVRVHCDSKSAKFLEGAKLIYTGNLMGGGFQFENPNAVRSCGCGTSFTPKPRES